MEITRIFHPVGQGAFYTECFISNGKHFNVVFDCGSENITIGRKEVSQSFTKNDEIDILFISHFHEDHINLLEDLKKSCKKIKKVIIPLQDTATENIAKAIVSGQYTSKHTPLTIEKLKKILGKKAQIISVNPYEIGEEEYPDIGEKIYNGESTVILDKDNIASASSFDSGNSFPLSNLPWKYIVYNFNICKYPPFIDELKNNIPNFKVENLNDSKFVDKNTPKIKKAYEKVFGENNLNSSSLVVLSLPNEKNKNCKLSNSFFFNTPRCFFYEHYPFRHHRHYSIPAGCVFTGDFNAKEYFKGSFKSLIKYCWDNHLVGTIQIPHHGAISSHNNEFIYPNLIYPISHAVKNKYGHPSSVVISDILSKKSYPHSITDEKDSLLVQGII